MFLYKLDADSNVTFKHLIRLRYSVTSDWKIVHFDFKKIVAAPKWYETW